MKKTLCFYFQVHLPSQLRRYRFFDIGNSHYYYDEFATRNQITKMAELCYLPMNQLMLDLINKHNKQFKIAFSITGEIIEQMERYVPHVLDSFKELAATGCVEFLCETYSHSLAFLKDEAEFEDQMRQQLETVKKHFGQHATTVRLTGLIYSDQIGEKIAKMGFSTMLTDGAKYVLGWKSPNYVYTNANNTKLNLLLRNSLFSDRISYGFSDQSHGEPSINCDQYVSWLNNINENEEVVNMFMDYITFGYRHPQSSGIFDFMKCLPEHILEEGKFEFLTPSEVVKKHKAVAPIHVPYPISWSEEERDLSIWLGNDLQNDAFNALCELGDRVRYINNAEIRSDWRKLQDSDHFYYMCTRWQSDTSGRRFRNPYSSAYDAYINYMNILSDLTLRINDEMNDKLAVLLKNKDLEEKIRKVMPIHYTDFTPLQIKKIVELSEKVLPKSEVKKASVTKETKTSAKKTTATKSKK